jgi:hypothetical protein
MTTSQQFQLPCKLRSFFLLPVQLGSQSQSFFRRYGSNLPTSLTYIVQRLKAFHLGDLLRIWVRPVWKLSLPRIFKGRRECTWHHINRSALRKPHPYLVTITFQGIRLLTKKRELFQGLPPTSPSLFALPLCPRRNISQDWVGNINPIPFRFRRLRHAKEVSVSCLICKDTLICYWVTSWLRTAWPMFNCCSHGTLLHISLQGSHLNTCYYHHDLHKWQLHPVSRPQLQCLPFRPPTWYYIRASVDL